MVKKSKDKPIETVVENKENFISQTSGKISEFFLHMMSYGGFSFEDGVMRIWGDSSIFIPIDGFIALYNELEKEFGEDITHQIFYWLGRLYGKTSTIMLIKRFGADRKDIDSFVNGATQDGMGYLKIKEYDKQNLTYAIVTGKNSTFATEYKNKYGKQKNPIDYYLAGMLAGGTDPLFDIFCQVDEVKCMACGDPECIYNFRQLKNEPQFEFFKKLKLNESEIIKKSRTMALKRKSSFSLLKHKDIKFGDGKFILKNITGVNFPIYGSVILNKIIEGLSSTEKLFYIQNIIAKESLRSIEKDIKTNNIQAVLSKLEVFGYGKFNAKFIGNKRIILSNENNPYPSDYMSIFGRSKVPVDSFLVFLLKNVFLINNKKVEVKEVQCRAKGDPSCIFEINFL